MIIDIDNETSVLPIVRTLTADWFSLDDLYFQMKCNGKTNCRGFWASSSPMLDTIANYIGMAPKSFRMQWNYRCSEAGLKVLGYHCTRHRNQDVFLQRGILPLSDEVTYAFFSEIVALLKLPSLTPTAIAELTQSIVRDNKWKYRSCMGSGPYFWMSYKEAKNPDNDYHQNGPEIWWLFVDQLLRYCHEKTIHIPYSDRDALRGIISEALMPFIIHCEIPYSMIPSKDWCAFNILKACFTFIDPEDDPETSGWIDLNGQILEPKYFCRIEVL
jgi:hypothetical protein